MSVVVNINSIVEWNIRLRPHSLILSSPFSAHSLLDCRAALAMTAFLLDCMLLYVYTWRIYKGE